MSPKDKAKELFNKMYHVDDPMGNYPMCFDTAKQCVLIAVEEMTKQCWDYRDIDLEASYDYWNKVKKEIELL